jgi:peptidoglycan-N-acetylglucosamine deacetylase
MNPAPAETQPNAPGAWRPRPFHLILLLLHGVALLILVLWPQQWPWAVATLLFSHLVLMAVGLWPRSTWLGANLVRLPPAAVQRREVAITIDDGPDPLVTPQVLEILAQHGVSATFFCIGVRAEAHQELCRRIVAAGHRLENHGARHPNLVSLSGLAGWRREILEGQQILQRITGQAPHFYRAVAGLRNIFLDPVLRGAGLKLASWTRRGFDTREQDPKKVFERLTRRLDAGDILLMHDGNAARTSTGEALIVAVLPGLLKVLRERELNPVTLADACSLR